MAMSIYTIEIDESVNAYLLKNTSYYGEMPNSILKRLLGLDSSAAASNWKERREETNKEIVRKAPRTSLSTLVKDGFLRQDDELILIVRGEEVCKAKIYGDSVSWQDKVYSMSPLAAKFLQKAGLKSDSVRGPAYWFTTEGRSVKEIWDEYLEKHYSLT